MGATVWICIRNAAALLILVLPITASAQAPTKPAAIQYQPLSYSNQGNLWGCGIRIVIVTERDSSVDSSINLNYREGRLFGVLKVGYFDLQRQKDKFAEKKREVTFAQMESPAWTIDTKRGSKSDDAGYYTGFIEGESALRALGDTAEGKAFAFTITVKGHPFDHRIEVAKAPDPDVRRQVLQCLGRLASRMEKDVK